MVKEYEEATGFSKGKFRNPGERGYRMNDADNDGKWRKDGQEPKEDSRDYDAGWRRTAPIRPPRM